MNTGKEICSYLKDIRREIAAENGIELDIPECDFQGECSGTCPRCDSELQYLENELNLRSMMGKAAAIAGLAVGMAAGGHVAMAQDTRPPMPASDANSVAENMSDSCLFHGTVTDAKTGEPLLGANVVLEADGHLVTGCRTNVDGLFSIKAPKGHYCVRFSYIGYVSQRIELELKDDDYAFGSVGLLKNGDGSNMMMGIVVTPCKTPVIEIGAPETGERIDSDRIKHMP